MTVRRLEFVRFRDSHHCEIAPLIVAGAIAGGSALAGGLLNKNEYSGPSLTQLRKYNEASYEYLAGITEQARKLNMHPLTAMGVSPPSYPGGAVGSSGVGSAVADAGAAIGGAIGRNQAAKAASRQEQRLNKQTDAQVLRDTAAAKRDEAEAALAWSRAMRIGQQYNTNRGVIDLGGELVQSSLQGVPLVDPSPDLVHVPQASEITTPSGGKFTTGSSSTAQDVENQYGDLAQEAYGLWRLWRDATRGAYGGARALKGKRGTVLRRPGKKPRYYR